MQDPTDLLQRHQERLVNFEMGGLGYIHFALATFLTESRDFLEMFAIKAAKAGATSAASSNRPIRGRLTVNGWVSDCGNG
jgi:hypothetical protein